MEEKEITNEYEVDANGNMVGITTYPSVDVEVSTSVGKVIIGTQEEYTTRQVIPKEKIPALKSYLDEQYASIAAKLDQSKEAMEQFEGLKDAAEKFESAIKAIPPNLKEGRYVKHMKDINGIASQAIAYMNAEKNFKVFEKGLKSIKKQLDFMDKHMN